MIEDDNRKWYVVNTNGGIRDATGFPREMIAKLLRVISDADKQDIADTPFVLVNGAAIIRALKAL